MALSVDNCGFISVTASVDEEFLNEFGIPREIFWFFACSIDVHVVGKCKFLVWKIGMQFGLQKTD